MIKKTISNNTIYISECVHYETYFTFLKKIINSLGQISEHERHSFTYGQYDNVLDYLICNYRLKNE